MAALDYFLVLNTISGESNGVSSKGWFDLGSVSFDFETNTAGAKVSYGSVNATLDLGTSLAAMLPDFTQGGILAQASIVGLDTNQKVQRAIGLETLVISQLGISGDSHGNHNTSVKLDFEAFNMRGAWPDATGDLQAPLDFSWDFNSGGETSSKKGLEPSPLASSSPTLPVTDYYIRIDGIEGDATAKGRSGWFNLDSFSSSLLHPIAGKTSGDKFDFSLGSQTALADLLGDVSAGKVYNAVEIEGVADSSGKGTVVYEMRLNNVTFGEVAVSDDTLEVNGATFQKFGIQTTSIVTNNKIDYGYDLAKQEFVTFNSLTEASSTGIDPNGGIVDYYIRFEALGGSSSAIGRETWHKIEGFDLAVQNDGGKIGFDPISITGDFALSSHFLQKHVFSGKNLSAVEIEGVSSNGAVVYELRLNNALVTSHNDSWSMGGGDPETVELSSFEKIGVKTTSLDATGAASGTQEFAFDLSTSKAIAFSTLSETSNGGGTETIPTDLTYYLRIDTVNGAAGDTKLNEWIALDDYTMSVNKPSDGSKLQIDDVALTFSDHAGIHHFMSLLTNAPTANAEVIGARLEAGGAKIYAINRFENIDITSYSLNANDSGDASKTTLRFNAQEYGFRDIGVPSKGSTDTSVEYGWNTNTNQIVDFSGATPDTGTVVPDGGAALDYYIAFDDINGPSQVNAGDTYKGFFALDSFSMEDGGNSKAQTFEKISLTLDLGVNLVDLLDHTAKKDTFDDVRIIGVNPGGGKGPAATLFDLRLDTVMVSDLSSSTVDGREALDLAFGKYWLETKSQNPVDGKVSTNGSFGFDNLTGKVITSLGTPTTKTPSSVVFDAVPTKYFLKIAGVEGNSLEAGRTGWFDLDQTALPDMTVPISITSTLNPGKLTIGDIGIGGDDFQKLLVDLVKHKFKGTNLEYVAIEGEANVAGKPALVSKLVLNDVLVTETSFSDSDEGGEFAFKSYGQALNSFDQSGKQGDWKTFAWDIVANTSLDFNLLDMPGNNAAPVLTVPDQTLEISEPGDLWVKLDTVLNVSDADGDAVTSFELRDLTGADNWWADGALRDASAGYVTNDLNGIWFRRDATPTTQTLSIRGSDGEDWSDWEDFTLTTLPGNYAPEVSIDNQFGLSTASNPWTRLETVMDISDVEGDTITQIQLWDSTGSNNWWADGALRDASTGYTTSDIANTWFRTDSSASVQTLWVRANDGTDWSSWESFQLTTRDTNDAPELSIPDQYRLTTGPQWTKLSTVMSIFDGDGDTPVEYQLWDSGPANNNWWADGGIVDATSGYYTDNLDSIWFQRESVADSQTLWVRANDGYEWGNWENFQLTSRETNAKPVVDIPDQTMPLGGVQWVKLSTVASITDADGDTPVRFHLWDSDAAVNNWWADGGIVDATSGYLTENYDNIWFQRDQNASSQTLWLRASDGYEWSAWEDFTLDTIA